MTSGGPNSLKRGFYERGVIAFRRVRPAVIVAIDGDHDAKFSSRHRHANHDLWLAWLDPDCCADGKCRDGRQASHPAPPNVRQRNGSQCQCLLAGTRECIHDRSERVWHDRTLAVGHPARRLAPERQRQLTSRKIFGCEPASCFRRDSASRRPRPSAKGKPRPDEGRGSLSATSGSPRRCVQKE
jgi:hypothetical protein